MLVVKTGSTYISACAGASNAISNHNTSFSGSGNSEAPLPTLSHHNRSRNSGWRSTKPEVPIFQLVKELATRFQIIIPRFRGRVIRGRHSQHCHTTTKVVIQDGGRQNRKYLYFSFWRIAGPRKHRFSVGIALLSCVQVEIWVLPDWRPPSWIYYFQLGRTVL